MEAFTALSYLLTMTNTLFYSPPQRPLFCGGRVLVGCCGGGQLVHKHSRLTLSLHVRLTLIVHSNF